MKNEILLFATTWIGLEGIYAKWNKLHKDKYHVISLIWNLKITTKKQTQQKRNVLIDMENKLVVARGGECREMSEIGEEV